MLQISVTNSVLRIMREMEPKLFEDSDDTSEETTTISSSDLLMGAIGRCAAAQADRQGERAQSVADEPDEDGDIQLPSKQWLLLVKGMNLFC